MLHGYVSKAITDCDKSSTKRIPRPLRNKRPHSSGPGVTQLKDLSIIKNDVKGRRCQSLSPSQILNPNLERMEFPERASVPDNLTKMQISRVFKDTEKENIVPHRLQIKMLRSLATKKKEFVLQKKSLITQQNKVLEQYAALKELETKAGVSRDCLEDMRILTLRGWPAHDLLLLVRDDLEMPMNPEIKGVLGAQILHQIQTQLNTMLEDVTAMVTDLVARRSDIVNLLRAKLGDKTLHHSNLERKTKCSELNNESVQINSMVSRTIENLTAKIDNILGMIELPWKDRDTVFSKIERLERENTTLQHKIEEMIRRENDCGIVGSIKSETTQNYQTIEEDLAKERAARVSLRETVSNAENMLRAARSKMTILEKQLKDTRAELDTLRRKHKDLEQLFRQREFTYEARSKKLLEQSKTGEVTIDTLSRQRDALELRVKELREQNEKDVAEREAELKSRTETLQAKIAEQERTQKSAKLRIIQLEDKIKTLEEQLRIIYERSLHLSDLERQNCLQYVPSKESEPSDRETDIWKELQMTRLALERAEDELRESRADKDCFLNSLSKIAQEEGADKGDKMVKELLSREKRIAGLQRIIDESKDNERHMEHTISEYKNELASLRFEVQKLRNYKGYTKEISYQDLQTELLDLYMQVETLIRERSALVNAAASRALMLERHERAADLFARMTRARRELEAHLEGRNEPPADSSVFADVSRSLTSMYTSTAHDWSALRVERNRVLRLEKAVLSQNIQLQREEKVRTQLERRRAVLEREIIRPRCNSSTEINKVDY